MTPQDKLQRAAKLIAEALAAVPDRQSKCPCCERTVYANWAAHQLHEALDGIPSKLQRQACSDKAFEHATVVELKRA